MISLRRARIRGFPALIMATLLCCGLLGSAGPAQANPLPAYMVFTHVHNWDPQFCENTSIVTCSQVVQYTSLDGDVEFDLFLDNRWGFLGPVSAFSVDAHWPAGWSFVDFQICAAGAVTVEVLGDHALLQAAFDSPLPATPESLLLLGRVRMHVSGYGSLTWYPASINGDSYGEFSSGEAGVECTYHYTTCYPWPCCRAHLEPTAVTLSVVHGTQAQTTLAASIGSTSSLEPCPVTFLDDEPWVSLEVQPVDEWSATVTVTVDASDLPVGTYETWVRGMGTCQDCSKITVIVEQGSPIQTEAWGGIKARFR